MKVVHILAVALVVLAVALALNGRVEAAFALCAVSTLIEVIGAAVTGKRKNT